MISIPVAQLPKALRTQAETIARAQGMRPRRRSARAGHQAPSAAAAGIALSAGISIVSRVGRWRSHEARCGWAGTGSCPFCGK